MKTVCEYRSWTCFSVCTCSEENSQTNMESFPVQQRLSVRYVTLSLWSICSCDRNSCGVIKSTRLPSERKLYQNKNTQGKIHMYVLQLDSALHSINAFNGPLNIFSLQSVKSGCLSFCHFLFSHAFSIWTCTVSNGPAVMAQIKLIPSTDEYICYD